jgi:TP53 regulating kinase-like protein
MCFCIFFFHQHSSYNSRSKQLYYKVLLLVLREGAMTITMDIDDKEEEEEEEEQREEKEETTTRKTKTKTKTRTTTIDDAVEVDQDDEHLLQRILHYNNNNDDGNDENRRREEQKKRLHLLSQGAEARVFSTTFLGKPCVVKQRFRKKYRHPVLDQKLTRSRLFAECRSLMKARILGVQAPTVLFVDKRSSSIFMERVEGKSLKEVLKSIAAEEDEEGEQKKEEEKTTPPRNATAEDATAAPSSSSPPLSSSAHRRAVKYGREIGLIVSKLHDGNITHGDLTTSNFLVHAQTDSIYVIDFGLSKTQIVGEEDIGVDLYVLERSLVSAHSREGARVWQECLRTWKETCGKSKEAFKRYEEVRARGRKRSMVG